MPKVTPEKMEVTWRGGGGMGGLVVMEIGKRWRAKNSQPNVTENDEKRDVETERQSGHKERWIFNERKRIKDIFLSHFTLFFSLNQTARLLKRGVTGLHGSGLLLKTMSMKKHEM